MDHVLKKVIDDNMKIALLHILLYFYYLVHHRKLYKLSYFKEIQCKEAMIEGDISHVQIDGDVHAMPSPIYLKIMPGVLKVVVPKKLD